MEEEGLQGIIEIEETREEEIEEETSKEEEIRIGMIVTSIEEITNKGLKKEMKKLPEEDPSETMMIEISIEEITDPKEEIETAGPKEETEIIGIIEIIDLKEETGITETIERIEITETDPTDLDRNTQRREKITEEKGNP